MSVFWSLAEIEEVENLFKLITLQSPSEWGALCIYMLSAGMCDHVDSHRLM